jgi:hypothetical protein
MGFVEQHSVRPAAEALRHIVVARTTGRPYLANPAAFADVPDQVQQMAIDHELALAVEALVRHGWTPLDLYEAARRRLEPSVVEHLLTSVATLTSRHPITRVDPRWSSQLASLQAVRHRSAAEWAWHARIGWPVAREALVGLLVVLRALPRLEIVMAAPGSYAVSSGAPAPPAVAASPGLREVRLLLARAEASTEPEQAEVLSGQAQVLMTQHSISRALAAGAHAPAVATRRLWLDAPYVGPKALLVQSVARSNHCFATLSGSLGVITLIGHADDLELVEMLTTSLLVQATRAISAVAARSSSYGTSRTRSYRQSFLVAYASRVGERLGSSAAAASASAAPAAGSFALAQRDAAVQAAVGTTFPNLGRRTVGYSSPDGLRAGHAAADQATLDAG